MTTLEPTTWLSPGQRVISDADGDRGVIEGPALYDASRVWVRWSSGASSMAPVAKLRHDVETLAQDPHEGATADERGCFQAWLLNVHNARWGRFTDHDMKIPQFGERQGQYRNEFLQQLWEAWSARAKAGNE